MSTRIYVHGSSQSLPVTEPFICPALYEEYVGKSNIEVLDEWTLTLAMGADLASKMENHYKTSIVSYVHPSLIQISNTSLDQARLC